jgi:hypothetical protein
MNDRERQIVKLMYDLQVQLFEHQGDEIAALQQANASLRKSHEVLGQLLKATADLMGVN